MGKAVAAPDSIMDAEFKAHEVAREQQRCNGQRKA